jgi:virginiamycin B lyase
MITSSVGRGAGRFRLGAVGLGLSLIATVLTTTVISDAAYAATWTKQLGVPGGALDVGVGANGAIWAVAKTGSIYKFDGISWNLKSGTTGFRISVDPNGNAWIVQSGGAIKRWNGSSWSGVTGSATDIGIGGGGQVWVTGREYGADGIVYSWSGSGWLPHGGVARNIDVDAGGVPWVAQSQSSGNNVFKWNGGSVWTPIGGIANDVGLGLTGSVWATGAISAQTPDNIVYRFTGSGWNNEQGLGTRVEVDPNARAWVVQSNGDLYRQN